MSETPKHTRRKRMTIYPEVANGFLLELQDGTLLSITDTGHGCTISINPEFGTMVTASKKPLKIVVKDADYKDHTHIAREIDIRSKEE